MLLGERLGVLLFKLDPHQSYLRWKCSKVYYTMDNVSVVVVRCRPPPLFPPHSSSLWKGRGVMCTCAKGWNVWDIN